MTIMTLASASVAPSMPFHRAPDVSQENQIVVKGARFPSTELLMRIFFTEPSTEFLMCAEGVKFPSTELRVAVTGVKFACVELLMTPYGSVENHATTYGVGGSGEAT